MTWQETDILHKREIIGGSTVLVAHTPPARLQTQVFKSCPWLTVMQPRLARSRLDIVYYPTNSSFPAHINKNPPRSVNRMSVPRDCARVVSGSLPPKMSPTLLQREKVSEMHAEKFECVCKCNHSERSNRLDFGLFLWGNTAQFLRLCWDGAIDVENKMNRMN